MIPLLLKGRTMMESRPIFDQFNLVVSDMEATISFYQRLGFTIPDTEPEWRRHHRSAKIPGGADLDFDSVEFARSWNRGWRGKPGGGMGVLGFRLPSRDAVDRLYEELTNAGYESQQPPYDTFWGARFAVVSDPDGNGVGLMSPVDPDRRTRPMLPDQTE
jgi:uncharacterized glyoxalase superfamily protein PhnB